MRIRHLSQDDLEALLALYEHLHDGDEQPPSPIEAKKAWAELMSNPRYTYYGGFVDGLLVASCNLTVIPNLTRGCRPYGLVENVVTHAAHRRRGYGRALLQEALREAWGAGCYKVMLMTGRKDEGTFRFYESAGFDRDAKQAFVARAVR